MPDDPTVRFERLYAESVTAMVGFCLRRCDSREDAADLVAEIFLVAWRRVDEIPSGHDARLWLFGVAHRLLANQQRALRRERNLGARLTQYLNDVAAPDPAALLDRHEGGRLVREALATLNPQDRALLTLVAWEGLTPSEAASVVGLSAGTVRVRLYRARGRLRTALAAQTPVTASGADLSHGGPARTCSKEADTVAACTPIPLSPRVPTGIKEG